MTSTAKHVIFYCDDCSLLDPVISVFSASHPGVAIQTSSDSKDLLLKVKTSKPKMILMYLHDPQQSYVDVLKEIREQADSSGIEVIVYRKLPSDQELEQVFRKSFPKR